MLDKITRLSRRWSRSKPIPFDQSLEEGRIHGFMLMPSRSEGECEAFAIEHRAAATDAGMRLFCGTSRRMYPQTSTSDAVHVYIAHHGSEEEIAEFCDAGIPLGYNYLETIRHALAADPEGKGVRRKAMDFHGLTVEQLVGPSPTKQRKRAAKLLGAIYGLAPFRISFCSAMRMKAQFVSRIDLADSAWIERRILRSYRHAGGGVAPLSLTEYMLQNNALDIWWHGFPVSVYPGPPKA